MTKQETKKYSRKKKNGEERPLLFSANNYRLLFLGIFLLGLGFTLMGIDGKFEGFMSLYIAPILILAGFVEILFVIFYPKTQAADSSSNQKTG